MRINGRQRRTDMAVKERTVKNLAGLYQLAPIDWDDVRGTLETNLTQEPRDRWARSPFVLVVDLRRGRAPAHDRRRRLLGR